MWQSFFHLYSLLEWQLIDAERAKSSGEAKTFFHPHDRIPFNITSEYGNGNCDPKRFMQGMKQIVSV